MASTPPVPPSRSLPLRSATLQSSNTILRGKGPSGNPPREYYRSLRYFNGNNSPGKEEARKNAHKLYTSFKTHAEKAQTNVSQLASNIAKLQSSAYLSDNLSQLSKALQDLREAFYSNYERLDSPAAGNPPTDYITLKLGSLRDTSIKIFGDVDTFLSSRSTRLEDVGMSEQTDSLISKIHEWEEEWKHGYRPLNRSTVDSTRAITQYIHDLGGEFSKIMECIGLIAEAYSDTEVARRLESENEDKEVNLNVITVSTIVSAVLAAIIAESAKIENSTTLDDVENLFWFFSLASSITSVIHALLYLFCRSHVHIEIEDAGNVKLPSVILYWIQISPRVFFGASVFSFQVGLCIFAFNSQPTYTSTITVLVVSSSTLAILTVVIWFSWVKFLLPNALRLKARHKCKPNNNEPLKTIHSVESHTSTPSSDSVKDSQRDIHQQPPGNENPLAESAQRDTPQQSPSNEDPAKDTKGGTPKQLSNNEDSAEGLKRITSKHSSSNELGYWDLLQHYKTDWKWMVSTGDQGLGNSASIPQDALPYLQEFKKLPFTKPGSQRILCLEFSPDGSHLMVLRGDWGFSIYHIENPCEEVLQRYDANCTFFFWFPDSQHVLWLESKWNGDEEYSLHWQRCNMTSECCNGECSKHAQASIFGDSFYFNYATLHIINGFIVFEHPNINDDILNSYDLPDFTLCYLENNSNLRISKTAVQLKGCGLGKGHPQDFAITKDDLYMIYSQASSTQIKGSHISVIGIVEKECIFKIPLYQEVIAITIATHKDRLLFEFRNSPPQVWKIIFTSYQVSLIRGQIYQPPSSINISDGRCHFAGSDDELVTYVSSQLQNDSALFRIWGRKDGRIQEPQRPAKQLSAIACSPSKSFAFAYGYKDGQIGLWSNMAPATSGKA